MAAKFSSARGVAHVEAGTSAETTYLLRNLEGRERDNVKVLLSTCTCQEGKKKSDKASFRYLKKKNHLQSHIIVSDTHEILSCPRAVPKEKLNIHPEKSIVY